MRWMEEMVADVKSAGWEMAGLRAAVGFGGGIFRYNRGAIADCSGASEMRRPRTDAGAGDSRRAGSIPEGSMPFAS